MRELETNYFLMKPIREKMKQNHPTTVFENEKVSEEEYQSSGPWQTFCTFGKINILPYVCTVIITFQWNTSRSVVERSYLNGKTFLLLKIKHSEKKKKTRFLLRTVKRNCLFFCVFQEKVYFYKFVG